MSKANTFDIKNYSLKNFLCISLIAEFALLESTNTEILISEVDIICILMLLSYKASNIFVATPGLFAIPAPTMETLDKFSV